MIYLQSFRMLSREDEESFFDPMSKTFQQKNRLTCYSAKYPFGLFRYRELPDFYFSDVTVFCGDNGSGKSTLLNVIADKLELQRGAPFNRTDFFGDYVALCDYRLERSVPPESRIITSDDVFENVLNIRRINDGVDARRKTLIEEYIKDASDDTPNRFRGLDDFERWKKVHDARNPRRSQSDYLRSRLMRNMEERSNGESALAFFVDSITEDALYLLDEPENSLSPANQLRLKYFLEDCARSQGCQFIISTHSPFLLSLEHATIYDLDSTPPVERKWTELDCVRTYYDFFSKQKDSF